MPDELALRLMATPTHQIPSIGLGDLSGRTESQRDDLYTLASLAKRREWARRGLALSNGSFPIPSVPFLRLALQAYGFAANRPQARRWITRCARRLDRVELLPIAWGIVAAASDAFARNDIAEYWKTGEGAAKIRWGTGGDFTRCVRHLADKVGPEDADRFCAQWHHDVNGFWPGDKKNQSLATKDGFPEHQKCSYGDEPATKRIIHSEAMAYIPVCDTHLQTGVDAAEICTPDGTRDPTNIVRIDDITTEGDDMPDSIAASAAEWSADFEYYWNPDTDEVFRVSGGAVEAFVDGTWTATQTTPEDIAALPLVDDQGTLEAIVGAVITEDDTRGADVLPQGAGRRFRIPVVIPENTPSGDRRFFSQGSLETLDPPFPLLWQKVSSDGHDNSVTVGKFTHVEKLASGGLGNAEGVFDTHEDAIEAARQVREGFLRGVSGDVDQFDAELSTSEDGEESITINHGRLVAATLVAKPAFQEATIELVLEPGEEPVIMASAGPLLPERAWFDNPKLAGPTMLTVTDDGRVFGHIAEWHTPHMGNASIKPPRSRTDYKYFNRRPVRTKEGADVRTGQLTLTGGHAALNMNATKAMAHYDDTRSAVADVVAGEDEFGIWVAGAMRPDITDFQVRAFRASEPSGDWRMTDDGLELVAVCQVNTPGFPVQRPRALVSSGRPLALVAAGTEFMRGDVAPGLAEIVASLVERVGTLESERDAKRRAELAAHVRSLRGD